MEFRPEIGHLESGSTLLLLTPCAWTTAYQFMDMRGLLGPAIDIFWA